MHGRTNVKNYGYCLESCNAKLGGFFYKNILRSVTIIFSHIVCKLRLNIFLITSLYFVRRICILWKVVLSLQYVLHIPLKLSNGVTE